MNSFVKIRAFLGREIRWLTLYNKFIMAKRKHRKGDPFFLVGTPLHSNLGDQAIALAEFAFLKKEWPERYIFEIPSPLIRKHTWAFRWLIGKHQVLVHGGGYLGTLWLAEEEMVRRVIQTFSKQSILIFPQTVYFEQSQWGEDVKKDSVKVFSKHPNLVICAREKESFQIAKDTYINNQVILVPDMVPYLSYSGQVQERSGVIFSLRSDKEKTLKEEQSRELIQLVEEMYHQKPQYLDTIAPHGMEPEQREKVVFDFVCQLSKKELVITDRLHGMVFAALAGTPCIALSNCNHKVAGVYDFIKENSYVRYVNHFSDIKDTLVELKEIKASTYQNMNVIEKYNILAEMIEKEGQIGATEDDESNEKSIW